MVSLQRLQFSNSCKPPGKAAALFGGTAENGSGGAGCVDPKEGDLPEALEFTRVVSGGTACIVGYKAIYLGILERISKDTLRGARLRLLSGESGNCKDNRKILKNCSPHPAL
jgi:hypothetical protein